MIASISSQEEKGRNGEPSDWMKDKLLACPQWVSPITKADMGSDLVVTLSAAGGVSSLSPSKHLARPHKKEQWGRQGIAPCSSRLYGLALS